MLGGEHGEELDGTNMYPPVFVLLTSGLGLLMAQRLAAARGLDPTSAWILRLLHASQARTPARATGLDLAYQTGLGSLPCLPARTSAHATGFDLAYQTSEAILLSTQL